MADMSVADYMAIAGDRDDKGFGEGYGWIILIFLFFLAFGGFGGFGGFGNNTAGGLTLTNLERDTLNGQSETQKEILQSNYQTLLGFKDQSMQMAQCCLTKTKNFVMKIKEFFVGNHSSNVMQVA